MLFPTLLLAFATSLTPRVLAQSRTETSSTQDTSTDFHSRPTTSIAPPSNYTVTNIFLPVGQTANVAASVVSANPDYTILALGCITGTAGCAWSPSATITEGASTLVYTRTSPGPATVSCTMSGGVPAVSAVCVGQSAISGLGTVGSTSTLASSQIRYVPVTITAGQGVLAEASTQPTPAQQGSSSTSSGAAAAKVTAEAVRWAVVGGIGAGVALWGAG